MCVCNKISNFLNKSLSVGDINVWKALLKSMKIQVMSYKSPSFFLGGGGLLHVTFAADLCSDFDLCGEICL